MGLGLGSIINMGGSSSSQSSSPTSAYTSTAIIDAETNTIEFLPYSTPTKAKAKALARAAAAAAAANRPSASTMPLLLFRRLRKTARSGSAIRFRILLSASIFLFSLLLLAHHRLAPLMGWNHHLHHPTSAPISASSSSSSSSSRGGGGYTVLINTWKRNDLLKQAVAHYAACSMTDAIHVVWSESDPPSDSLKAYLRKMMLLSTATSRKPSLRFELNKEDNLNNRFKPIKEAKNDAIFSIDDDVLVPCTTLNDAFTVWRTAPDTMVGFVPRMHWLDKEKDGVAYYKYGGWWSVWWMGTYSMILSKAAFIHRKYLDMYTYDMPSSIHDYVTRERNCEDIAMSLLVANATGAPPIWVRGKIHEIGSSGISSLKGHNERRNKCLNDFVSLYKTMPLVSSNMKAVDARKEWLW